MKQRNLFYTLICVGLLVPPFAIGSILVALSGAGTQAIQNPPPHQVVATRAMTTAPLSLLSATHASESTADQPIDSRPCLANPSSDTCNGVLPVGKHFSTASRDGGSGTCFDGKQKRLEDQPITDEGGRTIGHFQLWYLPICFSYTAHVVVNANAQTVNATVQQYNGSGLANQITKIFWMFGDQDNLLPSATETTGPLQDNDVWSPLLYSPNTPIQGSATIESSGSSYAPISAYYTAGNPTSINGQSF